MKKIHYYLLFAVLVFNTSCSKFLQIQQNPNWKVRYQAAVNYYEGRDFEAPRKVNKKGKASDKTLKIHVRKNRPDHYHACLLLEELLPLSKGLKESEDIHYKFAYCYYHQGQFLVSAHYFNTFFKTFQRSPHAEEALFMNGKALAEDAPVYELDQESTRGAIVALQSFLNRFPKSDYASEADSILNNLHKKLEKKAFENAKLYYTLGKYSADRYKAAVIAFNNFDVEFPDSKLREEGSHFRIRSQYELAKNSYLDKKNARFREVLDLHEGFVDKYPKSKFGKASSTIYLATQRALVSLAKAEVLRKKLADKEAKEREKENKTKEEKEK